MDQVDGTHIQSCWDADASAELDRALYEIEADLAVVKAPVDMRRLCVDEFRCSNRFGEADQQGHGEPRRRPMPTAEKILVEIRESETHLRVCFGFSHCDGQDPALAGEAETCSLARSLGG